MYAYKFVQTQLGSFFQESTYRKTIEEYAKQGWRLVQVLPIAYNGHGNQQTMKSFLRDYYHNNQ